MVLNALVCKNNYIMSNLSSDSILITKNQQSMTPADTYRHQGLRKELVVTLKQKGITDEAILNAIGRIPRHLFFNDATMGENYGYKDVAFQIAADQTISQPYTVARQTELLQVEAGQKILEIGTGSGYQATVLMCLKARVYSIERQKVLFDQTSKFLQFMKEYLLAQPKAKPAVEEKRTWRNEPEMWSVNCIYGDGFEGSPIHAPFDRILITAAVPELPKKLLAQLATGGKLVMPYGEEKNCTMVRITKHADEQYENEEFDKYQFVPMLKGKQN